jgi:UDP-N-acetyl-D-glucosamine dehydrogenase
VPIVAKSFSKNLIVVGQGYVGLPLSVNAAKSGYNVYGFDISEERIEQLKLGNTDSPGIKKSDLLRMQKQRKIQFTVTIPRLKDKSIIVIAVPTPLDSKRKPDLSMLVKACELISTILVNGSLVINESTSYIGTLRDLIKPKIDELSSAKDIMYAVAPERIDPGNTKWGMENTPRVVAGLDEMSTQMAVSFYSKFCNQIHIASKPEVAEAAKLFENTFRQVNIALVNELSNIADSIGFSTHEMIKAASTKPFGFMPFYPSIGVGGHCIPVDPSYLAFSAESVGAEAKFINLANLTNSSMPKIIAQRINFILDGNSKGKKIQIAGITYKPNISDLRESPALDLITELKLLGASVSWYDPLVTKYDNQQSSELNSDIDLGLIITPHDQIDFSIWKQSGVKVLDLSANSTNYGWPKFL